MNSSAHLDRQSHESCLDSARTLLSQTDSRCDVGKKPKANTIALEENAVKQNVEFS
jgi:hypothetical protein